MDELNRKIDELKQKLENEKKNEKIKKNFISKKGKGVVYPIKITFRKNKSKTDKYKDFFQK
jgi:hypothetical protein